MFGDFHRFELALDAALSIWFAQWRREDELLECADEADFMWDYFTVGVDE